MSRFTLITNIIFFLLVLRHDNIAQLNVVRIGDYGIDQSKVKVPWNHCIKVYVQSMMKIMNLHVLGISPEFIHPQETVSACAI